MRGVLHLIHWPRQTRVLLMALAIGWWESGITQPTEMPIVTGAERTDLYFPLLAGKQVGLVVNHTSLIGSTHLVDTLFDTGICIARIFAPEHGFRGEIDAGEEFSDGADRRTGAPIVSLYGKRKKPLPEDIADLDLVIFDIQDVGARFYTYISTLYYVMEACAEIGVPVLVLDRPNPNGHLVDGPVLDMRFRSFVGIAPLPIAHGCTVGELAAIFKGECWINKGDALHLTIIPCLHYDHSRFYPLPVKPSPNLASNRAVLLYPSLCLFEGSTCSVGRGTDWPFEVLGHPEFLQDSFQFVPKPNPGNKYPLYADWICKGWDFRNISLDSLKACTQLQLQWLIDFYTLFPNKPAFFRSDDYLDLLAGTDQLRRQLMEGKTEAEIRQSWSADLEAFKAIRKKYLLYP